MSKILLMKKSLGGPSFRSSQLDF